MNQSKHNAIVCNALSTVFYKNLHNDLYYWNTDKSVFWHVDGAVRCTGPWTSQYTGQCGKPWSDLK